MFRSMSSIGVSSYLDFSTNLLSLPFGIFAVAVFPLKVKGPCLVYDVELQAEFLEATGSVLWASIAYYLCTITKLVTNTLKMLDTVSASWLLTGFTHGYPVWWSTMQLYHWPACWKMSQPMIMALVVITRITAAFFYVGWCSRQDGQVRISLWSVQSCQARTTCSWLFG